ncbi:MAG: S8 family serine peptidase [Bacteroidota bacterium]
MRLFVWLSLVCVFVQVAGAQVNGPIFLNNERVPSTTLQRNTLPTAWPQNNCSTDGQCYAIIQFDHILTDEEKAQFSEQGVLLHQYIPTYAYLASYDGPADVQLPPSVTQLLPLEPQHKRPVGPLGTGEGSENGDDYELVGIPFPGLSLLQLAQDIGVRGADIISITEKWVHYRVSLEFLPEILASPALQYTESAPTTPFPEGDRGRSSSRIPTIDPGTGLGYTGEGIAIGIGDDGAVRHLDFHGRMVDHTQFDTGAHAEMTSGMAAGAGNIDPATSGSATGATVHLFDISTNNHIDWAPLHFNDYGIAITSTSFGEGCGEVYELSTSEIDEQVYDYPYLAHVFSAGNHGTDPCFNAYSWLGPNSNGNYYATITGGRKAGKNVLAVGNVEWNDLLLASSSRGPTPDGRIKPDLSALGQFDRTTGPENTYRFSSGTSAAAPNVAGAMSILYEQYREVNAGEYPSSALIKAMILNTADDMGPAGPDYHYGWGRMNASKALTALANNQYYTSTIQNGQQQQFDLNVPVGARNLEVMLYWHDPAGSVLSSRALVNDLELRMVGANGQTIMPWVPSSVANLDSLQRDALPGADHINNVEQISIPEPALGTYQVQITGFQVPEGPQTYFVVYSYELSEMQMLSPRAGATYLPGEQVLLTWDAIDTPASFSLEYSPNGGQSWLNLATDIPPTTRAFEWTVPQITTDQLMIRLRRSGLTSTSGHQAVVAAEVAFSTTYQNSQVALLEWDLNPAASSYKIYALGDRYMEVIDSTTSSEYQMPAVVGDDYWLSVAPVFPSGREGRRAIAQYYEHFGCESNVTLAFQFDRYPGETSWYILGSDGSIRASGGPYGQLASFSYQEEIVCLPPGCFTLVVQDAYNDGMCCSHGDGWYQLRDAAGNIMASGGNFGSISYEVFCVDPNAALPLAVTASVLNDVTCTGGSNGVIQAAVSGGNGNYSFSWSNGATGPTVGGLPSGDYVVTVTDGDQTATATVNLQAPPSIQITSFTTPSSCSDGSIVLNVTGGNPPYNISWADGGSELVRQNLTAGQYFVLVIDANGCQLTNGVQVAQASPLVVNLETIIPSCSNSRSGTITANAQGGNGNYQYQWSSGQTTATIDNLTAGTYSVTVTAGNCSSEQSETLVNPTAVLVSEASANPRCAGSNDGWIALTASNGVPPYTYNWSDGATEAHRFSLGTGVYVVTVTDAGGCASIRGFPLTSPDELQLSVEVTHVTDDHNGTIDLAIDGGTPPYQVQWNNGAESTTIEDLAPGQYVVIVTDANACSATTVATIDDQSGNETPELEYCEVRGISTTYEWIDALNVNGNNYASGDDDGFGDYTSIILPMTVGEEQQIELVPGYQSRPYNENWKVWIDYNKDGDFEDAGEQVAAMGPVLGSTSFSFVPPDGLSGTTRLRVAMRYGTSPALCSNLSYGEAEDYTIEWINEDNGDDEQQGLRIVPTSGSTEEEMPWKVYPNPTPDLAQVRGWSPADTSVELLVMNQEGRIVQKRVLQMDKGYNEITVDLGIRPPGLYQLLIVGDQWKEHLRVIKK